MKQRVRPLLVILVLVSIAFLGLKVFNKIESKKETNEHIKKLPFFSFVQMDGNAFSNENIQDKKGTIVINYFDPGCSHCQYMATQIVKNINSLSNAQIIMVTNADSITVGHFVDDYHLQGIKNIAVVRDPKSDFYKIFGSAVTPSFFIYKNGVISKRIIGETKIENIINEIK